MSWSGRNRSMSRTAIHPGAWWCRCSQDRPIHGMTRVGGSGASQPADQYFVVSRPESAIDRALHRMLEAEQVSNAGRSNEDWDVWQRAATDYWVLIHPGLARFRRGDPAQTPTVEEMRERAEIIARAMDKVPDTWRLAPPSRQRAEHLARVGWFHEQGSGLYGPIAHALERLRHDDPSGIETLVRFLESDVYCFRSGYMKAEVIRFLTRGPQRRHDRASSCGRTRSGRRLRSTRVPCLHSALAPRGLSALPRGSPVAVGVPFAPRGLSAAMPTGCLSDSAKAPPRIRPHNSVRDCSNAPRRRCHAQRFARAPGVVVALI